MDLVGLTLLEMIYRETLALEFPYEDRLVEEFNVDQWTLRETVHYVYGGFGWTYAGSSYDDYEGAEDQIDAALERLRERYGEEV